MTLARLRDSRRGANLPGSENPAYMLDCPVRPDNDKIVKPGAKPRATPSKGDHHARLWRAGDDTGMISGFGEPGIHAYSQFE